ncbi:hypothetical protein L1987_65607 [Smallanthus sonchifolius]|uniref:Uncharacterized protein n=1 Tax=Smallanthus sonchifolius TaxID=185202 RepID=A0ACB9BV00_9ASTR|nr:hypothetical protein L1987_65607 [Smallanthus sonchifolius]
MSSDSPPSFPSLGASDPDIQKQFQAAGDAYNETSLPPSYGVLGHDQGDSQNNFQTGTIYRSLDPTSGMVDNTKGPSFTAFGHGHETSYNQDLNSNRDVGGNSYGYSGGGQGPSMGAMARGGLSRTSEVVDTYNTDDQAPDRSAVNPRDASQTATSSDVLDDPDAQEFVGISLVGPNFKRLYPNAYYKEKDDEN